MSYTYKYPRPMVTVDAVVFGVRGDALELLLVERKHEPFAGHWALPGGFADMEEELETAMRRELAEETDLSGMRLGQFGAFGKLGRDPRGRTITIAYMALVASADHEPKGGDDAARAQWRPMADLPPLAFDHGGIITYAIAQLKEWTRCKGVGAGVLEQPFSLISLARLYTLIRGEPVAPDALAEHLRYMGIAEAVREDPEGRFVFVPARLAPV